MDLQDYSTDDLIRSLEAEIAKSAAEIRCAQGDLDKVAARMKFALAVLHMIKDRKEQR